MSKKGGVKADTFNIYPDYLDGCRANLLWKYGKWYFERNITVIWDMFLLRWMWDMEEKILTHGRVMGSEKRSKIEGHIWE